MLPVLLLPEEAALILEQGLVSLSIMVPASGQATQQHDGAKGAEGGWWQEEGGKVVIPHVPPSTYGEGAGSGSCATIALRRSVDRLQEWGLLAHELRGLQVCENGHAGCSACKSPGSHKRARQQQGQECATGTDAGLSSKENDTEGGVNMAVAEGEGARSGWRALWCFPATEVRHPCVYVRARASPFLSQTRAHTGYTHAFV